MNESELFADVLEVADPAKRAEMLDRVCGDDLPLRRRIERLLQLHEADHDFMDLATSADELPALPPTVMFNQPASDTSPSGLIAPSNPSSAASMLATVELPPGAINERPVLPGLTSFEVEKTIGRGGMGIVLKAHDTKLKRDVAIKVLAPHLAANGEAVQRFLREAQSAAAVRHENVVTIYSVDEANGVPFLVMELIHGESLQDRIKRGPLPAEEIVRFGIQIAWGLDAAHQRGLIHRDIKPANVLVEQVPSSESRVQSEPQDAACSQLSTLHSGPKIKITDFGLARVPAESAITQSGFIAGTPQYMSPEQANGQPLDHRSDLFSLGSVLYAMCVGQAPFRAESAVVVLRQVSDLEPEPILSLNPAIPGWLGAIITKLMSKRPEDRIQTAAKVADLLTTGGELRVARAESSKGVAGSRADDSSTDSLAEPHSLSQASGPATQAKPVTQSERIRSTRQRLGWVEALGVCVVVAMIFATLSNKPAPLKDKASTNPKVMSSSMTASPIGNSSESPVEQSPLVSADVPPNSNPSPPQDLVEIGMSGQGPKITADGLSLWFQAPEDRATGTGRMILWQAWRHATNESFNKPTPADESINNQPNHNLSDATISADGLVLCFCHTDVNDIKTSDLWLSTRPSRDASWSTPVSAGPGVNSDNSDWEPELSPNGLELFFHSQRQNPNGGTDLWVSRRANRESEFSPAENLGPEINSKDNEGGAALSGDGLTLMFHRFTPTEVSLWRSTRKSLDAPFDSPQRVTIPLPANEEFFSVSLSGSGEELYGMHRSKDRTFIAMSRLKPAAAAAEKNFAIRLSAGKYVVIPSLKLDPASPHTLEAWMTPQNTTQYDKHILGWPGPSSLFLRRDDSSWTFGLARTGTYQYVHDPIPITPGRRVHVAAVRAGQEYRLFVDGKRVASEQEQESPLKDQSMPFSLSVPATRAAFSGDYDEVRVSRVARYDDNFTPQARFQSDADTLALYHCDENGGNQLVDSSGHKHHGQIVGAATWISVREAPDRSASSGDQPALAIAPFGADAARQHQEACAKQFGVDVEIGNSVGLKLRLIPPGEFLMGAPDSDADAQPHEKPQHVVRLTKPFYLGATEVTLGQFRKFVEATKYVTEAESDGQGAFDINPRVRRPAYVWNGKFSRPDASDADPVRCVSWADARRFCEWLSDTEGRTYRLPTEAEWEFACRAGTQTRYSFGDNLTDSPIPPRGDGSPLEPVAQHPANGFGLFDMHGNVNEICWDSGREYSAAAVTDPIGNLAINTPAVVRGGAVSSHATRMRSSHRYLTDPRQFPESNFATLVKGFRIARMID